MSDDEHTWEHQGLTQKLAEREAAEAAHDDEIEGLRSRLQDYRRWQIAEAERRYARIVQDWPHPTAIEFLPVPTTDEWGWQTIGHWDRFAIQVAPMAFNDRLIMRPMPFDGGYDYAWCFTKGGSAFMAALVWDPAVDGEPKGFKKRVGTYVREAGETRSFWSAAL